MKTKEYLFLILFLFSCSTIYSQDVQKYDKDRNYFFIGGGGNWNSFSHSGLDFVIDRYNETRQGKPGQFRLTQKMDKINSMIGYNFGLGWVSNKYDNGLFYTMYFQHGSGSTYSEGYAPTDTLGLNLMRRDLKASLGNFSMGMGFMPIQTVVMDIGIGGQVNMDFLDVETKTDNTSYKKLTSDMGELGFGGSFYLLINFFLSKSIPLCLSVQPYYFYDFLPSDMSDVNEEINSATYTADNAKDQKGKMSHLGLQVQLNLCLFARKQEGSQRHEQDKKKKKRQTHGFSML
jgi:hypothetical protein